MKHCGSLLLSLLLAALAAAKPTVETSPGRVAIRGDNYTLGLSTERFAPELELRLNDGPPIRIEPGEMLMAVHHQGDDLAAQGRPATFAHESLPQAELFGQTMVIDADLGLWLTVHFLCTDDGVMVGAAVRGQADGNLWSPPRMTLHPGDWDGYAVWGPDGMMVSGSLKALEPLPAYIGVSPWGNTGRTFPKLAPGHPAVAVTAVGGGALAVIQCQPERWAEGGSCFLQRHTPQNLYLYCGMLPAAKATQPIWCWLAPVADASPTGLGTAVAARVDDAALMLTNLKPIATDPPKSWTDPLPDFPPELQRTKPVSDINDAMVYTMAETTRNEASLTMARKAGSDMLVRGWFKWNQRPAVEQWADVPAKAHAFGALFGGGITCSALYDTENGITREQLLDMATRGPDGNLVDAWDQPGTRHGSLSSPNYLDYLFRWCQEQIDAGADYLFMDEINAALSGQEGYDDHSIADFREFLLNVWPTTQGWQPDDPRWNEQFKIDLADKALCPDGTIKSFRYRAYLAKYDLVKAPWHPSNALAGAWGAFRSWRDDRAWKSLTDRIRAYAKSQGRTVLISGNGVAKYVDLQVLGVWGRWTVRDGHITLDENQVPIWRSLVLQGLATSGREVPVVLFHDWGFGEIPFPFMGVPRDDRVLWMRVRAPEIYAAGGKFAYPVLGPFGCNAQLDGSLPEIARQTKFWQRQRALFLGAQYVASDKLSTAGGTTSLVVTQPKGSQDLLLHVINRELADHNLVPRQNVVVTLPGLPAPTSATAVSPDFEGEQAVACKAANGGLQVTVPSLDAYTLVRLTYTQTPDLTGLRDPIQVMPQGRWARPATDRFDVLPSGLITNAHQLNGFLQGNLHPDLRLPPTFRVNALAPSQVIIDVRAVATLGAVIVGRVDGREVARFDLPDKDGSNDGSLPEYNQSLTIDIPAGQHEVMVENVGGDWATITRYRFEGRFGAPGG